MRNVDRNLALRVTSTNISKPTIVKETTNVVNVELNSPRRVSSAETSEHTLEKKS